MENKYTVKKSLDFEITEKEIEIADKSICMALEAGASAVQVTLDKAKTDIYALLDGQLDNIRQTGDSSLTFRIFSDGRFGVFSTNRFEDESLIDFLKQSVENVRLLAPDPYRKLPDPSETAKNAVSGDEMALCWYGYDSVPDEDKLGMALGASVFDEFRARHGKQEWELLSEEVEFNSTLTDTYVTNSDGLHCRQKETSFEICSQVTISDKEGNKYSGMWWDYGITPEKAMNSDCGHKAVEQAVRQMDPINVPGGRYTMVVSRLVSGKLLQPILNALGGRAIQQKSSFLTGSLGQKVFSSGLTVMDMPLEKGKCGAILFESDGRAARNREIITEGVVKEYFISTYMSGKLGMPATSESANRPVVMKYINPEYNFYASDTLTQDEITGLCGKGILVTGFNGGNCNGSNGDFSYGVEGFLFENGKISKPISNMLITGNIVSLWNNLLCAGTDPVEGMSRQVPTIAFKDVEFSA